ncbi:MAG: hypothetical protein ABSC45_15190 [Desulfobaccales bacterium]|jgi:hypothetical protein
MMTTPLARKVEGKKFMWDGGAYDDPGQARQVMEDYAREGFEVQMFEEEGRYFIYSRRLVTAQPAE